MKTHRIKNYLRLGLLLFGVSLLVVNYQKESFFEPSNEWQQKFKAELISLQEFKQNPELKNKFEHIPSQFLK